MAARGLAGALPRCVGVSGLRVGGVVMVGRRRGRGVRQPAAAAGAGSPLRAATECSRLSREEISTKARIAPATAKPAPIRNARSKPLVRATEALWTPEWKRLWVRLLAIVARIASPSPPPIRCAVLIRPDANPASCRLVPVTPPLATHPNTTPNPPPPRL